MKPPLIHLLTVVACFGLLSPSAQAESKRTAEYYLTTPATFEGKEVTLDVAMVKPVQWKSPLPEIAFFHAATIDRVDRKPGGEIMVAIPSANAEAFARKYGTEFKGRNDMTPLKGILTAVGGGQEGRHPKMWIIDATDGLLQKAIAEKRLNFPEEAGRPGQGGGGGGQHPFHHQQN